MAQLIEPRHTARLTLRAFERRDLDDLTAIFERADVNRFQYSEPRSREETRAVLASYMKAPLDIVDDNVLNVAILQRSSERVVGAFMLRWLRNDHHQGEIGGSLHPDVHGRGLAVEIYRELLLIAFDEIGLHRVIARSDGRNVASIRSLEKTGLRKEAHFIENEFVKGEWTDEVVYAIRRTQWQATLSH